MAGNAPDFTTLTDAELAQFAVEHQDALDVLGLVDSDITDAVAAGGAIPHLWLLFIAPEHQGKGLGRCFMRELLRQHAAVYHMSLYCHGARRRAFFGRLGFRIESRDGDMRRMTTNTLR